MSLLQSINDSFATAMRSKSSRDGFLEQLRAIVQGLRGTLAQQQGSLAERRAALLEAQEGLQRLVDRQRKYFKAVKEFQDECDRNEALAAQLEAKGRRRAE